MRTSSLTLLTAATLLSTSALTTTALAQKGVSLQPQSSWAVKNVNAGSDSAYCAMARRFNNGLVLTVAKNNSGATSLALDFSTGSFDRAQSYPVTLDAGAGQQRNLNVSPISNKAFVLKIGNDDQFFSALEKTGYLRVELGGENYNFNLADIDAGRDKLDACLVSAITPAAGDESPVMPMPSSSPAAGSPQVSALEAEKSRLNGRLKDLEAENEKLRLDLAQAATTPAVSAAPNAAAAAPLQQELAALRAEKSKLEDLLRLANTDIKQKSNLSIVKLSQENARLQALLDQKGNDAAARAEAQQLAARVKTLEEENIALSKKAQAPATDLEDLKAEIEVLKGENEALSAQVEIKGQKSADLSLLESDVDNLQKNNEALSARVASLMREKDEAIAQLSFYETENDSLKEKVATASAADSRLNADQALLDQLRGEIAKIERRNAETLAQKDAEIAMLETQIRSASTKAQELASADAGEADKLKAQIEALNVQNDVLKDEMVELSKGKAVLDKIQSELNVALAEKIRLEEEFSALKSRADTLELEADADRDLMQQLQGGKTDIKALEKKIITLESQNAELKIDLEASQQMAAADKPVKAEIVSLTAENESLRQSILSSAANEKALEEKLTSLVEENKILTARTTVLSADSAQIAMLQESLEKLELKNKGLQADIEQRNQDSRAAFAEISGNAEALKTENETLKLTLDTLQQGKDDAKSSLAQSLRDTEEKIVALNISIETLTNENKALRENAVTLKHERDQLELALDDVKADDEKFASLAADLENVSAEKLAMAASLEAARKENEALKVTLAEAESESGNKIKDLSDQVATLEESNATLKTVAENAESFNSDLQKSMQVALDNARGEIEKAGENVSDIALNEKEDEIKRLKTLNEGLEMELAVLKEDAAQNNDATQVVAEAASADISKDEPAAPAAAEKVAMADEPEPAASKFLDSSGNDLNEDSKGAQSVVMMASPKPAAKPLAAQEQLAQDEAMQMAALEPAAGEDNAAPQPERAPEPAMPQNAASPSASAPVNEIVPVEEPAPLEEDMSGMSEAQRYEMSLKRDLANRVNDPVPVPAPVAEMPSDVAAPSQELLSPAGMPAAVAGEALEEMPIQAAAPALKPPAPIAEASSQPAAPVNDARVAGSMQDIASLLQRADIALIQNVGEVGTGNSGGRAYQWRSAQNLFGSAFQKPAGNEEAFDTNVKDYLERSQSRCSGDFAVVPESSFGSGNARIDSYEIACIGNGIDSSAAIVFFVKNGNFTALAHEAPSQNMAGAMEARDRVLSAVSDT